MKIKIFIINLVLIPLSFLFFISCPSGGSKEYIYIPPPDNPEPEPEPDPFYIIPEPPEDIWVSEMSHEMITIAWGAVDNAKSYFVYCGDNGYEWPREDYDTIKYHHHDTSFTVTMLQSNTTYFFEVLSWNYAGDSYYSAYIPCTTDEAYGTVTFWPLWPPMLSPDHEMCEIYVDGLPTYSSVSYNAGPGQINRNILTGYRELKLIGSPTGRESGILIYLTTDGYVWNNRYDYDWKNY